MNELMQFFGMVKIHKSIPALIKARRKAYPANGIHDLRQIGIPEIYTEEGQDYFPNSARAWAPTPVLDLFGLYQPSISTNDGTRFDHCPTIQTSLISGCPMNNWGRAKEFGNANRKPICL